MGSRTVTLRHPIPCHVCGGPGKQPKPDKTNRYGRCHWCNGTGDEDYQDRAYDEWKDNRA